MKRFFHSAVLALVLGFPSPSTGFADDDGHDSSGTASLEERFPNDESFDPGELSIGDSRPIQVDSTTTAPDSVPPWPNPPAAATPRQPDRPKDPSAPSAKTGWIGIEADEKVVPGRLVLVDVAAGSPAAEAGIKPKDRLVAINGVPLRTADELAWALAPISPGTDVDLAVEKEDGRRVDVSVRAVARPAPTAPRQWQSSIEQPAPATLRDSSMGRSGNIAELPRPVMAPPRQAAKGRVALGVRTVPVDQGMQSRYRLAQPSGAYVVGVVQDLPASKAGVPPGSVIVALGSQTVRDPDDLTRLVTRGPAGSPVSLQYVLPGGESRQAEVVLQSLEIPLERALTGSNAASADAATLPPTADPYQSRRVDPAATIPLDEEVKLLRWRLDSLERRLERTLERSEPSLRR